MYTLSFDGIQLPVVTTFSDALADAIVIGRIYPVDIISNLTGEVLATIKPHEDPYISSSVTYMPF